jgi:hypothetical protein
VCSEGMAADSMGSMPGKDGGLRPLLITITAVLLSSASGLLVNVVADSTAVTKSPWIPWGYLVLLVGFAFFTQFHRWRAPAETVDEAQPPAKATADPLDRAVVVLGELRTLVPMIGAELAAQERTVAALQAKAAQHEEDARKNEARAKLYEQAADAVRDLVADTYRQETEGLRQQLRQMERKNRREQLMFAVGGALIGAATQFIH